VCHVLLRKVVKAVCVCVCERERERLRCWSKYLKQYLKVQEENFLCVITINLITCPKYLPKPRSVGFEVMCDVLLRVNLTYFCIF
jgi:hypothetical protein